MVAVASSSDEPTTVGGPTAASAEADAESEERDLDHGQAEAVLSRALDVREELDDALADLIADVRGDPAKLRDSRLEELDAAVSEVVEFEVDLNELREVVDDGD